ncbi:glycosyltransferase family 4 protein [Tomitella fengzijianii]|uniref:Glycosyltransferase family 4 protein n=1 Tax=Tomitella fengzijianii TaxID=2597660 RepID=A0A516X6D2_9ACTN|nr:glycosyltransferase family 4 protein [Tomitella fengzijianii]QDQ98634.1 glycosyltransferase family 4 protein [Tomitella fengzijianii]
MRIALLSYRSKPHCGGQGVYVRHLSRGLAGLGHEVEVFSGQPYPELDPPVTLTRVPSLDLYREPDPFRTPRPSEIRDGIDLLELATMWTAGFPEPLTFSLRAARILGRRAGEFDVVHDNQCLGYGLLRMQRAGLPVVATIHHPITRDRDLDLAAAGLRRKLTLRRWYGFLAMQGRVARRIPTLLTVSRSSEADVAEAFDIPDGRLHTIPLGVDTALFAPSAAQAAAPGGAGPFRIACVASADMPLKGVGTLLEAVAKLRTEHDVRLDLVSRPTPGGATERLMDRLSVRDIVDVHSGIDDDALAGLLAGADVACVPSLYEGFSLPAVEAMSCGTALVASAAGALPEVVGTDGAAASLVPPGDAGALVSALGALLTDPPRRRAMGAAGRARAVREFSWESVAAKTVEKYESAIAARRAGMREGRC